MIDKFDVWFRGDSLRDVYGKHNMKLVSGTAPVEKHSYDIGGIKSNDMIILKSDITLNYRSNNCINPLENNGFTICFTIKRLPDESGADNNAVHFLYISDFLFFYLYPTSVGFQVRDPEEGYCNNVLCEDIINNSNESGILHCAVRFYNVNGKLRADGFINGIRQKLVITAGTKDFDFNYIDTFTDTLNISLRYRTTDTKKTACIGDIIVQNGLLSDEDISDIYNKQHYHNRKPRLLAHFPFNVDCSDITGNSSIINTSSQRLPSIVSDQGILSKAMYSNGIVCTDLKISDLPQYSYSFWFKPKASISSPSKVIYFANGEAIGTCFQYTSSSISIFTSSNDKSVYRSGIPMCPIGVWTHITVTVDNEEIKIYKNNVEEKGGTILGKGEPTSDVCSMIGSAQSNEYMNDVRFYDGILSDKERQEIYNCEILHYDFDNLSSDSWNDYGIIPDKSLFNNDSLPHVNGWTPRPYKYNYNNNTAIEFDRGKPSCVRLPQTTKLKEKITVSLWAFFNRETMKTDEGINRLIACDESNNGWSFFDYSDEQNYRCKIGIGDVCKYIYVSRDIIQYGWNNIVLVYDGVICKCYVNSKEATSVTLEGKISYTSTNTIILGAGTDSSIEPTGTSPSTVVDNVRIFANSLSLEEISKLYNADLSRFISDYTTPQLLAHFPFINNCNMISDNYQLTNNPTFESVSEGGIFNSCVKPTSTIKTNCSIKGYKNIIYSFWINPTRDVDSDSYRAILQSGDSSINGYALYYRIRSETVCIRNVSDGTNYLACYAAVAKVDSWTHISIVIHNDKDIIVYTNGVLAETTTMYEDPFDDLSEDYTDINIKPYDIHGCLIQNLKIYKGYTDDVKWFREQYLTNVLHYSCNEQMFPNKVIKDLSPFHNDSLPVLSEFQPLTSESSPMNDYSWKFTGSQYIEVPSSSAVVFSPKRMISVSFWFNLEGKQIPNIASIISSTEGGGIAVNIEGSELTTLICTEGVYKSITIDILQYITGWHYMVFTYDQDGEYNLFIDSKLESTSVVEYYPLQYTDMKLSIGAEPNYSEYNGFYSGLLDDVKIFAASMTQEDVDYEYNKRRVAYNPNNDGMKKLLCHYPLEGDIIDRTGSTYATMCNGDAIFNHKGFFYKSLKTGLNHIEIANTDEIQDSLTSGNISLSVWAYISNDITVNMHSELITCYFGDNKRHIEINKVSDNRFIIWYNLYNNTGTSIPIDVSPDTWAMVTLTRDSRTGVVKMYLNDKCIVEDTPTLHDTSNISNIQIGGHTYDTNGYINDFKMYNYVISEQEVRKNYIQNRWNYSFDEGSYPVNNLISSFSSVDTDDYSIVYDPSDNTYLITMKRDASSYPTDYVYNGIIGTCYCNPNESCTLSFEYIGCSMDDTEWNWRRGGNVSAIGFGRIVDLKYGERLEYGKRYHKTINHYNKWPHMLCIATHYYSNFKAGDWWKIKDPMIYKGEYVADYVPPNSLEETIIYDNSGYGNNIKPEDNLMPRLTDPDKEENRLGKYAYYFDGNNKCIGGEAFCPYTDRYTISTWFNIDPTTPSTPINKVGRSILSISSTSDTYQLLGLYYNDKCEIICTFNKMRDDNSMRTIGQALTGKWNHFVARLENNKIDIFLNSELVFSIQEPSTNVPIDEKMFIYIGDYNNNTNAGIKGYIDETKIYYGALNEDEINQLYRTSVHVDENSTKLYAKYFKEKDNLISDAYERTFMDKKLVAPYIDYDHNSSYVTSSYNYDNKCINVVQKAASKKWVDHAVYFKDGTIRYGRKYLFLFDVTGTQVGGINKTYHCEYGSLIGAGNSYGCPSGSLTPIDTYPILSKEVFVDTVGFILDATSPELFMSNETQPKRRPTYNCIYTTTEFESEVSSCTMRYSNFRLYDITDDPKFSARINYQGVVSAGNLTDTGMNIRYIRNWLNGNNVNRYNHFVEIQAYKDGSNIALNKPVLSAEGTTGGIWNIITDGELDSHTDLSRAWIQVDLGDIVFINYIKMWHYYNDNRSYHDNILEVSIDGINWISVFDSNIDGEYPETVDGKTVWLDKTVFNTDGNNVFCNNLLEG